MSTHDTPPPDQGPPRFARPSSAFGSGFSSIRATGILRRPSTGRPDAPQSEPGMRGSLARGDLDLFEATRHQVLGRTADLPVLPAVAVEALRLVRNPRVRTDELLGVVEQDPPLAARILSVANSSFYARGASIAGLRHAVVRLGLHALRDVIYMAVYANTVFDAPGLVEVVRSTFDHCVVVARLAQRLGPHVGVDHETAFLAGLLHDVGRARCIKVMARLPQARGRARAELEEIADRLHEAAGAALATAWNLPGEVVEACARHHEPVSTVGALIRAADVLSHFIEDPPQSTRAELDDAMARIGVSREDVDGFVEPLRGEVTVATTG